jgi:hypothetical protein
LSTVASERESGFRVERVGIASTALRADAPPVRVAHLSDLHLTRLRPRHMRLVECVNQWEPDVICLTGDLVSRAHESWGVLQSLAEKLRATHGVFACTGNWEIKTGLRYEAMRQIGDECGLAFLINEPQTVQTPAGLLRFAGIDDLALGWPHWEDALGSGGEADYTILLSHVPLAARLLPARLGVDLVLSGHTHGGQVRIPLVWRLFLPSCHGGLVGGLHSVDGGLIYVSRGFGAAPRLPLRLLCPAEVAFITLRGV